MDITAHAFMQQLVALYEQESGTTSHSATVVRASLGSPASDADLESLLAQVVELGYVKHRPRGRQRMGDTRLTADLIITDSGRKFAAGASR